MTGDNSNDAWQETTWQGKRRRLLRDALQRTVRERLERLEALAELNRHFRRMRREGRFDTPDPAAEVRESGPTDGQANDNEQDESAR